MHTPISKSNVLKDVVFIGNIVKEILALHFPTLQDGKYTLEPLKNLAKAGGVPLNILVDKNVPRGVNEAEIHRHEADLWIVIDGTVYFETGGTLINPYAKKNADGSINDLEIKAKEIIGGTRYTLTAGDILYIPEGQPHVHWTDAENGARLWIIKIPAREIFPIAEVAGFTA